jgi:fatty-acyl-CoA synthase
MMHGLLQDSPLTLRWLFERMERVFPERAVCSARRGRVVRRRSYRELAERARRLSSALDALGIEPGERVATFCFNHDDHLEQMLGIMAGGRVYHALNPRLSSAELRYIVGHAGDTIAFVDADLLPAWRALGDLPSVRHVIVVRSPDDATDQARTLPEYEAILAAAPQVQNWRDLDENAAAALCYTSGTTGNPKGVLYSHRGLLLVAMAWLAADAAAVSQNDRFLPVVPFFHAQAWALPLTALLAGSDMILAGADVSPPSIAALIRTEQVTLASGVPTIWRTVLDALEAGEVNPNDLAPLDRIICGGSAVPQHMLEAFDRLGCRLIQVWGMTEMSPLGTVSRVRREVAPSDALAYRAMQGQPSPLVSLRIMDEKGNELPWNGEAAGEIQASGPWIADAYLDTSTPGMRTDAGGFVVDKSGQRWLRTGDIATMDPMGNVRLVDRAKDLIKSGGEWISSVQLEQIIELHPAVAACAVIAVPHPKWDERPLAMVELKTGQQAEASELLELVRRHLASWQVPDEVVFVAELPRNSLGKIDKRALRHTYAGEAHSGT